MNRRRAVIGLAVLAALAVSAVTAAGASATGTTAFTCVKKVEGDRKGPHCLAGPGGSGNEYTHKGFTTKTTGIATNANTASETTAARTGLLEVTLGGLKTEITCAEVGGEGSVENKTESEDMYVHVTGKLHFKKCELLKPQPTKCSTPETNITEELVGTTKGQGDAGKISPVGELFTKITISGAECPIKGEYPVKGSVTATLTGATVETTAAGVTASGTLTVGGQKAGLEGAITLKAHEKDGEETTPLTVTTPPYTE